MTGRWDIAVFDRNDQLVLVIEVKNKLHADSEWAARLRRNIFAHGIYPNAPFFLMVFPDQFYLWTSSTAGPDSITPDYTIDARPILNPFFEQAGLEGDRISSQSLELIVESWLSSLIHSDRSPNELTGAEQWLVKSGLYAAMLGGRLEHEVAV